MGVNCTKCLDLDRNDIETNLNLYLKTIEEESHQHYTTQYVSPRGGEA